MENCLRWELEKRPLVSTSLAVGPLQESQRFSFTAILYGFKFESVNLRQREEKTVG